MATHGKKYKKVKAAAEEKVYDLTEAIRFLKANKIAKFDETAELANHMTEALLANGKVLEDNGFDIK